MTVQALIGITAGILSFLPCPFYIHGILKGETRPDRVTWWMLALVSGMITASSWASGVRDTIWFPAGYTLSFLIVALFSLKYGEGPVRLHTLDRVCLLLALGSAAIWWTLQAPLLALIMNICTECIALIPTMVKAYRRPWTEEKRAWVITTAASILNLFAVSEWTLAIALYPVYAFVTNAAITYLIVRKRNP
jgi:hypothetical protein